MSLSACRNGQLAGPNPWDAPSLEWSTPSPPPPYNFPVIPRIASRHPLWESRLGDGASVAPNCALAWLWITARRRLATTALDAVPDAILKMPDDTPAPFIVTLAMSVGFVGLLLQAWWLAAIGAFATLAGLLVWLWPERELEQRAGAPDMTDASSAPRSSRRQHRPSRQRLVGHDDADRHRGRALRLSSVRLLLRGGSAWPELVAGEPSGLQVVASRHDRLALEQRGRLATASNY